MPSPRCIRLSRASKRCGVDRVTARDAAQGPRLHRIAPASLGSGAIEHGAHQSNDTRHLTPPCPRYRAQERGPHLVHNQKPRGSHRLSCASATCNSLRRQATGPQQRKGESSPNPRSCARLTQVFGGLQASKPLKAPELCMTSAVNDIRGWRLGGWGPPAAVRRYLCNQSAAGFE
jgi:hypothetical protein